MTECKQNSVSSSRARNYVSSSEGINGNSFHERQENAGHLRGTPFNSPNQGDPWHQTRQGSARQVRQGMHYHQSTNNGVNHPNSVAYHHQDRNPLRHERKSKKISRHNKPNHPNYRSLDACHSQEMKTQNIRRSEEGNCAQFGSSIMEDSSNRSGGWIEHENFVCPTQANHTSGYANEHKCMQGADRIVRKPENEKSDENYRMSFQDNHHGPPFQDSKFKGNAHCDEKYDATCHNLTEQEQSYNDYSYGPFYGDHRINDVPDHLHQSTVPDRYNEHMNSTGSFHKQVHPMKSLPEHFNRNTSTKEDEEEDDDEDDFSSDSEEKKAVEKAYQKLLAKVKEVVDKVCGTAKPSLVGNVELACLVCSPVQYFKGWKALVAHAQTFRKRKVVQHRGYYKALDSALQIKEDLGQGKDNEVPSDVSSSLIDTSLCESHIIVWPPVVVIERIEPRSHSSQSNEILKGKWITQGEGTVEDMPLRTVLSQELQGLHPKDIISCGRSRSVIVFEASSLGYMEAKAMNDHLHERKRGRQDWLHFMDHRHSSLSGEYLGKTTLLFGYLAEPADLKIIDPNRTIVEDWSEESYREKVQGANKRLKQEHEHKQAKLKAIELEVETLLEEEEKNKIHKQLISRQIQIKDKEIKEQQNQICKMREHFAEEDRELCKNFEENLQKLEQQFSTTVNTLKEELERDEKLYEDERNSREKQIQIRRLTLEELKEGYEKLVEEKALDREAEIIVKRKNFMEEVRKAEADINARIQSMESSLQSEQQEEMEKLAEENEREREEFYREWMKENETMKEQVEELKKNKEQEKDNDKLENNYQEEKASECMICWEGLTPENRALLIPCGHTQMCIECAQEIYSTRKECPMCRQKLTKKPMRCPKSLLVAS